MDGKSSESADHAIAGLASRQHGVVTRRQLLELGIGRGAIEWRLRNDRLHRMHSGVYVVGHTALSPRAAEMGAALACGPSAVISHRSAGILWLLPCGRPPAQVEVTVYGRRTPAHRGIRTWSTHDLAAHDVRRLDGVPVAPARTLLDLAGMLSEEVLEACVAEAQGRRLIARDDLIDQLDRNPTRRGAARLRHLLLADEEPARTRSVAERKLLLLLRAASLPSPATNTSVGSYEVDFLWAHERLIVEVDGFAWHASRRAFERDRERDAELQLAGYRVLRVTWRQLQREPKAVLRRIATALAAG